MKLGRKLNKMIDGYVNTRQLCMVLDCARITLTLMIKANRVPQPEKIGGANFWKLELVPEIKKRILGE
jgi:predicted DNA-binding transcriptional regulator AlpA